MKKTPKHGTVAVAKQPIVVGTMVIPQGSVGTVVYREKGATEVNVDWGFVVAWVNIKDIRKYDQN